MPINVTLATDIEPKCVIDFDPVLVFDDPDDNSSTDLSAEFFHLDRCWRAIVPGSDDPDGSIDWSHATFVLTPCLNVTERAYKNGEYDPADKHVLRWFYG